MALSSGTIWEIRSTGSDSNAGGLNVSNANFPTDLAATAANTSAPVVTSASYTFVAGDVGYNLFIKSGTNLIPGFYPIASVSAGAATLNAAIGAAYLFGGATILNTVAGCATVASPTGGTWGMDYSYNNTARYAFTDMVIDGTTNTKFTSAAKPVGKNMVGNLVNVASGTGFTVQTIEVVSTSGTTATCDKSLGTLSSTGGTGNLGGAIATIAQMNTIYVNSGKVFITGSYTSTATNTISVSNGSVTKSALPNRLIGYGTTRGDGGKATITLATNTGLIGLTVTGQGWIIENITVDCAGLGTSTGIKVIDVSLVQNCLVKNFTSTGIYLNGTYSNCIGCEVTAGASAGYGILANSNQVSVRNCNVHDNVSMTQCALAMNGTFGQAVGNLVTNNSGAACDGIQTQSTCQVFNNTVYNSGRHGIAGLSNFFGPSVYYKNNILAYNGGYGLQVYTSSGFPAYSFYDGNAYYSNTSGTRNNADDLTAFAPDGVAPYVNVLDVILSADPFVAKASNDYRLNTTAGGGAAARGHGVPTLWPGNSLTVAAPDMGAAQSAAAAGGMMLPRPFNGGYSA